MLFGDQALRLPGAVSRIGPAIDYHGIDLPSLDAACRIGLRDRQLERIHKGLFARRHDTRQGVQYTDPDALLRSRMVLPNHGTRSQQHGQKNKRSALATASFQYLIFLRINSLPSKRSDISILIIDIIIPLRNTSCEKYLRQEFRPIIATNRSGLSSEPPRFAPARVMYTLLPGSTQFYFEHIRAQPP